MDGPEKLLPDFRPGDTLMADTMSQIVRKLTAPITIKVSPPLACRQEGSNVQIWLQSTRHMMPCVVSTAFTPRSGSTPGKGEVELQMLDPSTDDLVDTGVSIDPVYCISSTAAGVPIDTYGNVEWDDNGIPWLITADCT